MGDNRESDDYRSDRPPPSGGGGYGCIFFAFGLGVLWVIGFIFDHLPAVFRSQLDRMEYVLSDPSPSMPLDALLPRAQSGKASAEAELGTRYLTGHGGATQDYAQALVWLKKAADQGDAQAENALGYMYDKGEGVPMDGATAVAWYQKAAAQDFTAAEINLGAEYFSGTGVKRDYATALGWFQKAAAQDEDTVMAARADDYLGRAYEGGKGVTKDYAQALALYKKSADGGDPVGECHLGNMYRRGLGAPADCISAMWYLKKAAKQHNGHAEYLLGEMYAAGQDLTGTVDADAATDWYQKAAADGYHPDVADQTNAAPAAATPAASTNAPSR